MILSVFSWFPFVGAYPTASFFLNVILALWFQVEFELADGWRCERAGLGFTTAEPRVTNTNGTHSLAHTESTLYPNKQNSTWCMDCTHIIQYSRLTNPSSHSVIRHQDRIYSQPSISFHQIIMIYIQL